MCFSIESCLVECNTKGNRLSKNLLLTVKKTLAVRLNVVDWNLLAFYFQKSKFCFNVFPFFAFMHFFPREFEWKWKSGWFVWSISKSLTGTNSSSRRTTAPKKAEEQKKSTKKSTPVGNLNFLLPASEREKNNMAAKLGWAFFHSKYSKSSRSR